MNLRVCASMPPPRAGRYRTCMSQHACTSTLSSVLCCAHRARSLPLPDHPRMPTATDCPAIDRRQAGVRREVGLHGTPPHGRCLAAACG